MTKFPVLLACVLGLARVASAQSDAAIEGAQARAARVRAENRSGLIVPGARVGSVALGQSRAVVRQKMGRAPDSTFALPRGLSSELWKWRPSDNFEVYTLETVYRAGRVVQIEVAASGFQTARGSSSNGGFLDDWYDEFGPPLRTRAYRYNAAKKGVASQKYYEWTRGFTLETRYQPNDGEAVGGDYVVTVLVHPTRARPIVDFDGFAASR